MAGPNLDVERVDRTGFDPDQNLTRLRMRPRDLRHPERGAGGVEHRGLHGFRCCRHRAPSVTGLAPAVLGSLTRSQVSTYLTIVAYALDHSSVRNLPFIFYAEDVG